MTAQKAIQAEISRREQELQALRDALTALSGGSASRGAKSSKPATPRSGKRRPKTAAEKAALSKALKAAWKRRQSANGKSAGKTAKKVAKKSSKKAAKQEATASA